MKCGRKCVVYIAAIILFLIYLFSADFIFNILMKTEREARLADISLPPETNNIEFVIDDARQIKLKWKDALSIRGWVFKRDVKEKARNVYLVLKGNTDNLIYDIRKDEIARRDVTDYFRMGGDVHSHGFELELATYRLKEDLYQIGFVIEDETGRSCHISSKALVKTNGTWSVPESAVSSQEAFLSERNKMPLKKASQPARHYIDMFEDATETVTIAGWGFLNGLDTDGIEHYILFKNGDEIEIFSTTNQTRKDVTAHFEESELNLDESGYLARVPKGMLQKGRYLVGLYMVKGKEQGVAFFAKHVTIQ
ncbi:MAG: hypothetical protein ACYDH0_07815 [Candidatus Aminicenantales bacterium]